MHNANLDIDLLRSFAAVADTGSFTAAGELVSRTQSAVSIQIKRLEEALDRRLFERTSRSLALTPSGETLLAYARRMLDLNDEIVRRVAEPPVTGRLRVGITEYFVPGELPRILARFAAVHPGVHLEVKMGLSRDLREELGRGGLDLALVRLQPRESVAPIWSERQVWVASRSFEAAADRPLPLALLPAPCVLREYALESLTRRRRPFQVVFTGSSMASLKAAISAGLGVSILPASLVDAGLRILPSGRAFPDPGTLRVGLLRGAGVGQEVVGAWEGVLREVFGVLVVTR